MVDLFRRAVVVDRAPAPVRAATFESPTTPLTSETLISLVGGQTQATAGKSVTQASALGVSAVWRSVNLIATTCGGLPMHAYEPGPGNVRKPLLGGPVAGLLRTPHPDLTPLELWELVYASLCLWGNAYLLKLYNQHGELAELWWVNPARVRTMRLSKGPAAGEKRYVLDGNEDQPYSDKLMLHIPGFGYDGVCGVSPIRAAAEGLGLALAAEEFGARFFGSGALATGILQTEQRIEQDDANRLKELWRQGGSGLDSAHDIRVMGAGAKFQALTIPQDDAQFLQTREFQVTDVARWYGIPPHLLMQTEKSTSWGTGIESQNLGLITYTLQGYLQRVEQRLSRITGSPDTYVKIGLGGLLRGDSASRAEFYSKMWDLGAFSTNDIRRFEDLEPVEGGDVRFVPLNYGPLIQPAPAPPEVEPGPDTDPVPVEDDSPAAKAAKLAQQLYLSVGKVLTVAEARALVASGAGVPLEVVDALTVFEDMPPLPSPLADDSEPEPAPEPDPADPDTETEPTEQDVPADAGS